LPARYAFQSTLPRGERPRRIPPLDLPVRFNPRSRGGSDHHPALTGPHFHVSIHAPAGGATDTFDPSNSRYGFNPRSRGGSDKVVAMLRKPILVSIHAPAGGATKLLTNNLSGGMFQSTLPRGERLRRPGAADAVHGFNPRSRGGSDGHDLKILRRHLCFNPRSRGGSDNSGPAIKPLSFVSIHAPAGGATQPGRQHPSLMRFQSTLPRGERRHDQGRV